MTIVLLALLGTAEPAGLLADGAPRQVQLAPSWDGWPDHELRAERERLKAERPGLGLPFGLLGGGLFTVGGLGAYLGVVFANRGGFDGPSGTLWAGMFGVAALVGLGVASIGAILLARAFPERRAITRALEAADRRLRAQPPADPPVYVMP